MEKDLKLKSFANGVFSTVFREYNSTFSLPVRLPQTFGSGGCSPAESRSVLQLGSALREAFSGAFTRAFVRLRRSPRHFVTYLTSRCLRVCPDDDPFRALVTVCALIAELNLFCCLNNCFAFLNTAPRCLVGIFDRKLRGDFYAGGGWDAFGLFCEDFVKTDGELKSLDDVLHRLEENSSSDSDGTEDSEEEDSDEEEEEAPKAENVAEVVKEKEDDEDEEINSESESSESDSDDSEEEAMDGVKDSDDDSEESSDESDPSSMTEDENSDSEESSPETLSGKPPVNGLVPEALQVNGLAPGLPQANSQVNVVAAEATLVNSVAPDLQVDAKQLDSVVQKDSVT